NSSGSGATGGGDQALLDSVNSSLALLDAQIIHQVSYLSTTVMPEVIGTTMALTTASQHTALLNDVMDTEKLATQFALVGAQIIEG
ncbi:hypothetical protein, partial [Acinetobacter brisouii]